MSDAFGYDLFIEYEYDSSGNMTKETEYTPEGEIDCVTSYSYNDAGQLETKGEYTRKGFLRIYEYFYDSKGFKIKEIIKYFSKENEEVYIVEHDFVNDRNGRVIYSKNKNDDFAEIYQKLQEADGIIFVSAVYWHDMTECMKVFVDRLRRCETGHNHFLKDKRVLLVACAGGTGNGAIECLHQMEEACRHMGMRAYDRIPVIRFNQDYMLPALEMAGKLYGERLPDKFV